MRGVVGAGGEGEFCEVEGDGECGGGGAEAADAVGHYFGADAVAWDYGNAERFGGHCGGLRGGKVIVNWERKD